MPRQRAGIGEYHRPGQVRRLTPQFGIDKISDPAGEKSDGHHRYQEIGDLEEGLVDPAAVQPAGDEYPDQPAVERHAALPDLEHVHGVAEVVRQVVEQHRSQPAADDDAQDAVEHEVCYLLHGPAEAPRLRPVVQQRPSAHNAGDITEPVPADLD